MHMHAKAFCLCKQGQLRASQDLSEGVFEKKWDVRVMFTHHSTLPTINVHLVAQHNKRKVVLIIGVGLHNSPSCLHLLSRQE